MDHFDPYNVFLAIATKIPQRLITGFVVQGHTHIYIYIYIYILHGTSGPMGAAMLRSHDHLNYTFFMLISTWTSGHKRNKSLFRSALIINDFV